MNHPKHILAAALIASVSLVGLISCATPSANSDDGATEVASAENSAARSALEYPQTMRQDIVEKIFGQMVHDPYRWLEDAGEKKVQAWMAAQDQLTRTYLGDLDRRDELAARFRELFYVDALYAPAVHGGRYFYARRSADQEKTVYYWKEGADGEEHVLLDPNAMSEDGSVSVGGIYVAWDGKKIAYKLQENNADAATLYVKNVATGEVSDVDIIEGAKYAYPSWTPDSQGFYYTYLPKTYGPDGATPGEKIPVDIRPGFSQVRFHKLGTNPEDDPVIHTRTGDARAFLSARVSRDGRWLIATISHGWGRSDVYFQDLKAGDPANASAVGSVDAWKPFITGTEFKYSVWAWKDHFYIYTDENAPNGKLMKVSVEAPAHENWVEVVPASKDRVLDNVQIIGGHLVLTYMVNAHSLLEVRTLDGDLVRQVELPGVGVTYGMKGQPDRDEAYYSFESFTTPRQIYKTSIKTGERTLWEKLDIPVDPSQYKVEQVWYESKDGTKVSMFVVHRKDIEMDGSTPFLLYGYGGFNVSMRPSFRASIYPWLDAGGGYAVPNLRGGGEYGEEWHQAGMLENKQNVFDDFIAAAEFLIEKGYTSSDKLAISGGSNGGLLVGAVMTQRPELFRAVICSVPLLDMLRYHEFGSGKTWMSEYGNPEVKEDFEYLYAYSPYHNVKKGVEYPALLMQSADSDDRVDPMHARKFTAAIQYATASEHPVLLRIAKNAGHGGGDMIKKYVKRYAGQYAFLMQQLGMEPLEMTNGAKDTISEASAANDGAPQPGESR
jgi:prolyl oligopeptidase